MKENLEINGFVNDLLTSIKKDENGNLTKFSIQSIINKINLFLYTKYDDIGETTALGETFSYFSDFHKFWEKNHRNILNAQICEKQCKKVAKVLHEVYVRTGGRAYSEVWATEGISKENVCKIRFLTANQDFNGSRSFKKLAEIFNSDNSIFDVKKIIKNPGEFIEAIKISNLSQNDKRINYASNAAQFIVKQNCEPVDLATKFQNDAYKLRKALIEETGMGYGNKKTDMFIRDMYVLKIWPDLVNFDKIDVASDINTIKIALRTGILQTDIPLLSSFLDVFCYQYGYIDEMSAKAWRKVWEIWKEQYPTESVKSPALLDYFIYKVVGQQFCKENLYIFKGDNCQHVFRWHSARNKTCQECYKDGKLDNKAHKISQVLPCTDSFGSIAIEQTEFVKSRIATPNYKECPFKDICTNNGTTNLQPPKSISIKGRTGWTTAYTDGKSGGGGLMA